MALADYAGLAQYDLVGVREDLSDVVSQVLLNDTNLLARIGISGEATNITHSWLEESLNPTTVTDADTGAAGLSAGDTTWDVAAGHGLRLRVGALLRDTAQGKTEVIQVTAISTDALTIARGYGSTTGETHAAGAIFSIVGMPKQSGADVSADVSVVRTSVSNFCQIFERGVQVAGDTQAVTKAGVPDEMAHQVQLRLMELLTELSRAVISGVKSASGGSDSVYRSMGGLIEFLNVSGGNIDSDAEDISVDVINDMAQQIYDDGGMNMGSTPVLVCNQVQMRKISKFDADKIRTVPGTRVAGTYVTQFMTDLGVVLDIVTDRWMPKDTVSITDLSRVKVVPLAGRAFGTQDIAKTGDAIKKQLLGDYTLEVRNATQAHAIHTNLTVPA